MVIILAVCHKSLIELLLKFKFFYAYRYFILQYSNLDVLNILVGKKVYFDKTIRSSPHFFPPV